MAKAVLELIAQTAGWDGGINKATKGLNDFIKANGGLHNVLANNSQIFKDAIAKFGDMGSKSMTMSGRVRELSNAYLVLGDSLNKMTAAERNVHGQNVINQMRKIRTEVLATKEEMNKLNADLNLNTNKGGFFGDFAQFGAIFQGNIAATAVMGSIRGLGDALRNAVQTNIDFEQSNATLASVLGTTTDKVIALTNNAKYLGATTVWTAGEISELQTILARRGFGENQILNMTKGISSLATATGVGLADAAELASSAMQSFQLPAQKMDDIVATLGVATTKSALDMEKLKYAFAYVAPAAKAAGFSIEEAVSMLGALADAGLPATTAGMATRNVLLDMTDSSSRLAKGLGKPVHSLDEFVAALNELRQKGGNNLETIGKLVDDRVVPAFSVFLNSTDKMIKMREEVTNVRDELQGMVDNQINTMQGSLTLLTSAWDGLMLSFSNSTGPMKVAVDGLTKVINKLTELHNSSMGGDAAITQLEKGLSDADRKEQEDRLNEVLKGAMKDGKIDPEQAVKILSGELGSAIGTKKINMSNRDALRAQYDNVLDKEGTVDLVRNIGGAANAVATGLPGLLSWAYGNVAGNLAQASSREEMEQQIADYNDWIAKNQYYIDLLNNAIDENMKAAEPNNVLNIGGKSEKTPLQNAQDKIEAALTDYEIAIRRAALEKETGYINEEQYTKKILQAEEKLFNVYGEVASVLDNPEFKQNFENEAKRVKELATQTKALADAREEAARQERQLLGQKLLYTKILRGLEKYANQAGVGYDAVGITGMQSRIATMQLGDVIDLSGIVDALNGYLRKRHLQIAIDFETGSIEKLKDQITEALSEIKTGAGAVRNVIGALDSIKQAGESVAEAFKGDADAWEAMMSVFNLGFTILDGILSTIEAINTLQELSAVLQAKNTALKVADTTATVANTTASAANASAKGVEAAAAGASATANTADAVAKGAGSVAWVPGAGPALAVAAIMAIIGAIAAARAAGKFATGGIVPGNSYSGDKLIAQVNSGEGILTRQGVKNLGALYAGQAYNGGRAVQVYGRVSGKDILLASNNYNRARGGSRSAYTQIK